MSGGDDGGGLFPVAVLIDELKSSEIQKRVRATKQLKVISEALGFERTREELIPYVTEKGGGWDDDDEVLMCIAEQFSEFVDYVGGVEYADCLLQPLEQLVSMEEPAVRDKAVSAIKTIMAELPDSVLERVCSPMIYRMGNHEWDACKAGAAAVIPQMLRQSKNPETIDQLRKLFVSLCEADVPLVKRAAGANMAAVCKATADVSVLTKLLRLFATLGRDEQDGVRLVVIENAADVALELANNPMGGDLIQKNIIPIVRESCQDVSWRVRYMLCVSFKKIAEATQLSRNPSEIARLYRELAEDREAEVRTAAAHQIATVGLLLKGTREARSVLPYFTTLCKDENNHVRAAAAANIVEGLSNAFSQHEVAETLLPLLEKLLRDESSDVRLNVIGELGKFSGAVGFHELSNSILPAVTKLATDPKWRVREGVINVVPNLAKLMGAEKFDSELLQIVVGWLTDQVCEIRSLVARVLCDLWQVFGESWAKVSLLPKVVILAMRENYMHRVALLHFTSCASQKSCCSVDTIQSQFLPLFNNLARDQVPNVRFNVANSINVCCVFKILFLGLRIQKNKQKKKKKNRLPSPSLIKSQSL